MCQKSSDKSQGCRKKPDTHRALRQTHIILSVSGGVADVLFKSKGVAVTVFDYDVEGTGAPGEVPDTDPDGEPCRISEFAATESITSNPHWPIIKEAIRHDGLQSHLISFLPAGFIILTDNGKDDAPDQRYESWAYRGPLDFDRASPIFFGSGADPYQALTALSFQLARNVSDAPV